MAASTSPEYTVFISHAGEDKGTIAFPLRDKLNGLGITAFVDEADMPLGTIAEAAMISAMETAEIAVVVLSPEFVARKWPMKELMCFLRRRDESGAEGVCLPVIIPFFYRLSIPEMYEEPQLFRLDKDGKSLYGESRFLERMARGEPEANADNIRAALRKMHGTMGARNFVDATNDSAYLQSQRREILLEKLCEGVQQAVAKGTVKGTIKASETRTEGDSFRAHYDDTARGTLEKLVLNFFEADKNMYAHTPEGKVLEMVADASLDENRVIAVHGIGGVGKTSLLRGLSCVERVKQRFEDGVYLFWPRMDSTERGLMESLSSAVENSGGQETSRKMRKENDFGKVTKLFQSWFAEKQCLFMVDGVWKGRHLSTSIIHQLLSLHESGRDSKVLVTTRSVDVAASAEICRYLEPRKPLDSQARAILVRYSGVKPEENDYEADKAVNEILERCGGLPLFLAIAGTAVRTLSVRPRSKAGRAYYSYASRLHRQMASFMNSDVDSYERLQSTLSVSVALLEEKMCSLEFHVDLTTAEMHRRLSVLEKQARVPMSMLRHLWELGSEVDAAIVAQEFEKIALADIEEEESGSGDRELLRLHDSLQLFASHEARLHKEEKVGHEAVLKGYGEKVEKTGRYPTWWSPGLNADGYIHEHLCRHLIGCGRYEEVVDLLLHPEWTDRMFAVCGSFELERDFDMCISALGDADGQSMGYLSSQSRAANEMDFLIGSDTAKALKLLKVAVSLSSTFIAGNRRVLWFQLHGRLKEHAVRFNAIRVYVDRIEKEAPRPWLRSINCFLAEPGGANTRMIFLGVGVACMEMMKDGKRIACGCEDGRIAIVIVTRSEKKPWEAHKKAVRTLAVVRDGKHLISGSEDGTAKVWDIDTRLRVSTFRGHASAVNFVAMMEDGRRVLSGSKDGMVQVWDMDTGLPVSSPFTRHVGTVMGMVVLPDGENVITKGSEDAFWLWNAASAAQTEVAFVGHKNKVTCVAATPDGSRIVSGSLDGTVKIWNVAKHAQIAESSSGHTRWVRCVAVNAHTIVSGSNDNTIRVWNAESGKPVCDPLEGHRAHVTDVLFLPGSDSIVSCSLDGTVRVWDVGRKNVERVADRHEDVVTSVSFTPDGKRVVSGSEDGTLRIWDATWGRQHGDPLHGHSDKLTGVAVTRDGRRVVSVSDDKKIRIWDLGTRECLNTLTGHADAISCVAVTPNRDLAVTGSADKTVRVWNLANGSHFVLDGHSSAVCRIFLSDDGRCVVSVDSKGEIFVWLRELESKKYVNKGIKKGSLRLSRKQIMDIVGESTCQDDADLSILLRDHEIRYGQGQDAPVVAALEASVMDWEVSPDRETVCLALQDGHVAFMGLET